jgi:hypothetical protein
MGMAGRYCPVRPAMPRAAPRRRRLRLCIRAGLGVDIRKRSAYAAPMNTHTDPATVDRTTTTPNGAEIDWRRDEHGNLRVIDFRIPEWRRRALAAGDPYAAVTDTTGLVAL